MRRRSIQILVLAALALALSGCGTTVDMSYVMDSMDAANPVVQDYAARGCKQITVAPAFTVNWEGEGNTTFGGGVFVGCAQEGRLVEFQCHRAATPEDKAWCQKLRLWVLKIQGEEPPRTPR